MSYEVISFKRIISSQVITMPGVAAYSPLFGSAVDLNFANGRYWNGSGMTFNNPEDFLACSRASDGTAINAAGVVEHFASDVLRVTTAGLLIEEARLNSLPASQSEFTNATYWSETGLTLADDTTAAPDGTATASTLTETVTGAQHLVFLPSALSTSASTPYTASAFMKAGTNSFGAIVMQGYGLAGHYVTQIYDLQNGVLGENSVGSLSGTFVGASITPLADGWYRCTLTSSVTRTDNTPEFGMAEALTGNTFGTAGDPLYLGAGNTIFIWGAQQELGYFATSYIPTTTTALTRAADNITSSGAGDAGLVDTTFRGAAGSIIIYISSLEEISTAGTTNIGQRFITDDAGVGRLLMWHTNPGDIAMSRNGLINSAVTGNVISSLTATNKVGGSWGASLSVVLNGDTVDTAAEVDGVPVSPTHIGAHPGPQFMLSGTISRMALWNSKIADATLQGFTT